MALSEICREPGLDIGKRMKRNLGDVLHSPETVVALFQSMKQNPEISASFWGNAHKSGRIDRHTEGTDGPLPCVVAAPTCDVWWTWRVWVTAAVPQAA